MTSAFERNDRAKRPPLRPTLLISLALGHGASQICQFYELGMMPSLLIYVLALLLPVALRNVFFNEEENVHPSLRGTTAAISRLP